jgi:predicted TIM-barrel fold metal-dependent hydrolase
MRCDALDRWGVGTAILNSLYGVNLLFDVPMATMFARAVNDWITASWLDKDPALRASIVVPIHDPDAAIAEIERRAPDRRFVQVLFPAAAETPYGRKTYWPIYEVAVRHGLPIGIHAGSTYRHPVTAMGWPDHYVEDYIAQAEAFQAQLASLVSEGAFAKFPDLCIVLIESGVAWLPAFLWRFSKFWRGLRTEVPWVDRSPTELIRHHVRMTIQPLDAPDDPDVVRRVIDHIGSEEILLFSSDYPHWQFDGDAVVPRGIDAPLLRKMAIDNPRATYPRLEPETRA